MYGPPTPPPTTGRPRLRLPARRAPQARRHPGAAPPRVPRAAPRRLPLHPVLRVLPPLAAHGAACPCARSTAPARSASSTTPARSRAHRPATGEVIAVELFVAVLGASNYTYAEATRTQQVPDWIASHQRAFAYFSAASRPPWCRISSRAASSSPAATSRGCSAPTRSSPALRHRHPAGPAGETRDKAKVEAGVQVAERWILARLRHEPFFSLAALNARIAELLGGPEHAADAPVPRQPPGALRAPGPARPPAPAGRAVRLRRVEDAPA